jgi:hypothetical protein
MAVLWSTATDHSNTDSPKVAAFLVQLIIFPWRNDIRAQLSPGRFPQYEMTCLYPEPTQPFAGIPWHLPRRFLYMHKREKEEASIEYV